MLVATTGVDLRESREKGDLKSVMMVGQVRVLLRGKLAGGGGESFEVWGRQALCILKIAPLELQQYTRWRDFCI